jgi:hypothetical protein
MKKGRLFVSMPLVVKTRIIILILTASARLSLASFGQGLITLDGSNNTSTSPNATTSGRVFINGVLDTSVDINCELLYSSSQNAPFEPVVTLLLSSSALPTGPSVGQVITASGDITGEANGTLLDFSGEPYIIPGIGAGQTAYFLVLGWLGNYSSYAAALNGEYAYPGLTSVFSEVLSPASSFVQADINNMAALNMAELDVPYPPPAVPEPSSLMMAGVGLGSMLVFGCRRAILHL